MNWQSLYQDHHQHIRKEVETILDEEGYEQLIVFAGEEAIFGRVNCGITRKLNCSERPIEREIGSLRMGTHLPIVGDYRHD